MKDFLVSSQGLLVSSITLSDSNFFQYFICNVNTCEEIYSLSLSYNLLFICDYYNDKIQENWKKVIFNLKGFG